eukprot:260286_1
MLFACEKNSASKMIDLKNAYHMILIGPKIQSMSSLDSQINFGDCSCTDRLFNSYTFHSDKVSSTEHGRAGIERMIIHYLPNDKDHTDESDIGAQNMSSRLKSPLPIGIWHLFHEWLHDEILDDSSMEMLSKQGVTSLNEACNKSLNEYACKYIDSSEAGI